MASVLRACNPPQPLDPRMSHRVSGWDGHGCFSDSCLDLQLHAPHVMFWTHRTCHTDSELWLSTRTHQCDMQTQGSRKGLVAYRDKPQPVVGKREGLRGQILSPLSPYGCCQNVQSLHTYWRSLLRSRELCRPAVHPVGLCGSMVALRVTSVLAFFPPFS